MAKAKQGDKVKIDLTVKLENGDVYSSSKGQEPLEFTIGEQDVIPKVEEAVIDMSPGESKEVQVLPEEGFGTQKSELIQQVPRTELPPDLDPKTGMQLKAMTPNEQEIFFTVTETTDTTVTLDANHPLAGKTLTFEIEVLELV